MRLISFNTGGNEAVGVLRDDQVFPLDALLGRTVGNMREVISAGPGLLEEIGAALNGTDEKSLPLSSVTLLPVVTDPQKIICIGLNYADHAKEGGNPIPEYPALFMRAPNSLMASGDAMVRPACSDTLDYEAELLLIIGRQGKHVTEENALDYVFGYSIFNDGSVRAYQRKGAQWTPGKNFDRTGPAGPWIVTADELPPGAAGLDIQSRLNGQVMQSSNTDQFIFTVPRIIAVLSEFMTLEPGDMVAMGTPAGVGYPRNPPVFMRPGDVIEVEIEKIGVLSNPVIDEADLASGQAAE